MVRRRSSAPRFSKLSAISRIWIPGMLFRREAREDWCERRDSNPHAFAAPEPKSGASTNSATFAATFAVRHRAAECLSRQAKAFRAVRRAIGGFYRESPYTVPVVAETIENPTRMSVDHYENFPVASVLLPARLRRPGGRHLPLSRAPPTISPTKATRRPPNAWPGWTAIALNSTASSAASRRGRRCSRDLRAIIARIRACRCSCSTTCSTRSAQDVVKKRYADFAEVLDYCRRSANPVGRLLLHLLRRRDAGKPARDPIAICSALQLINFWQDVAIDWRKDRIYLPQDEMRALRRRPRRRSPRRRCDAAWRALMRFQVDARARLMLKPARRWAARCTAASAGNAHDRPGRPAHPGEDRRRARRRVPPPAGAAAPSTGRCMLCARRVPLIDDSRRILPAEGRAERLELLLLLPVPAAGTPPRHHRALRLLPRSRRRRRRMRRRSASRAPSSPGGAAKSRSCSAGDAAASGDAGARAARRDLRRSRTQRLHEIIDGMEMDLDAEPLSRFRGAGALLPPRRRRGRPARRGHLRLPRRAARSSTPRRSASRSSSPTSSATSARTRARTASTCRWTN